MSPRTAALLIVLALAAAAGAWLLFAPSGGESPAGAPPIAAGEDVEDAEETAATTPATLYLLGGDGYLHGAEIEAPADDEEARIRALLEALLATADRADDLASPLPPGTELGGLYFLEPAALALDLRLPEGVTLGGVGAKYEMLSLYSLVNTVTLNSERIERVVVMVDGQQPPTLAGHIDLTRPLTANRSWIAPSSTSG